MIRIRLLTFFLALSAAGHVTAQTPGTFAAKLKPDVTIIGELVRIGDLVDNAGAVAGIAIFRAPDLGQTGAVETSRVLDAVMVHGLIEVDTRDIAQVVVRRASRMIAVKDLEARIARALAVRYGLGDVKNLTVTFDREVRPIALEPSVMGELQPARLAYDPRSGRFDVTFEIADNALARITLRYTGAAVETIEAAVPVRSLARGEVLKAADVAIERRPKAEIASDTVRDPGNAVGMAARRALRAGQPLHAADLMKPEIVQKNESVTLVYEVPGLILAIRGKAIDSGAQGDVVNVLNIQSKRTVQGTVVGPGRVLAASTTPRLASSAVPPP